MAHGEVKPVTGGRSSEKCGEGDLVPSRLTSPGLDPSLEKEWRRLRRGVVAAGKGFAVGAGLKGGLAMLWVLIRLRSRRKSKSMPRKIGAVSNGEAVVDLLKETLQYGLFVGTFAGTYVLVDECIAAIGGQERTASWRALLAGALAGPSMLLTGAKTQHTSLALDILMRSAVLASRCGIKSKHFGNICKPLTWSHGDIFLMCVSTSQILSAYILKQDSMPSSYKSSLNKLGGKDFVILEGVKNMASGMRFTNLEGIEKYYKSIGIDIKLDPDMKVPCSIVHGHHSCARHVVTLLFQFFGRALPFYLPVYLVPALILHHQELMKRPYSILGKSLLGTARSSFFLSATCSSGWMWTCILSNIFKRYNTPMVATGAFLAGLALAIEKKSRRMDLSLYSFTRAIEIFFTWVTDAGMFPEVMKLQRADVVIFSLAMAIIMHCYEQEREVFRSKYLNVLDWIFGVPLRYEDGGSNR